MFYSCQIRYYFQTLHFDEISKFKCIAEILKEYLRSPYFALFFKQIRANWVLSCLPCRHWFLGAMRGDLRLGHVQWKERCLFSVLDVAGAEPASGCVGKAHLTLSHEAKVFKDKRVCQNKSKQERRPTFKVHVLVLREQELMDPRKTLSSLLCPCTSQYWRPNSVTNWMQIAQNPLLSQAWGSELKSSESM